jgi:hypothetical protein
VMGQVRGGSYQVGTKDGVKVYLDRYSGPDGTGVLVFNMNMPPAEAREVGQALIDQANKLQPPPNRNTA